MAKIILIYASMTGNTEEIAEAIVAGLREAGEQPVVKEVLDVNASELSRYDGIVLGAYTWGDGELPDEYLDFYDDMDDIVLQGKCAAAFGSCDSGYPAFGAAVDLLLEKLERQGADIALPGLKIELSPTLAEARQCKEFGQQFAAACAQTAKGGQP